MALKRPKAEQMKWDETNAEDIKPGKKETAQILGNAHGRTGLGGLRFSRFLSDKNLENILETKMPTVKFVKKYMGFKWMENLEDYERTQVMDICDRFLNTFVSESHWFRYLETLDVEGVAEEISEIGIHLGFESNLNKLLGINFSEPQSIDQWILPFKTVRKIIDSVPSCRFEIKNKSGEVFRRTEFLEPLLIKMLKIYVRCLICAIRKCFICRLNGMVIVKWDPRSGRNSTHNIPAPLSHPTSIASKLVEQKKSKIQKWIEEFISMENWITVGCFQKREPSWVAQIIYERSHFKDVFAQLFPIFAYTFSRDQHLSKKYFINILETAMSNLKTLTNNGELKLIVRKVLNGCWKQNRLENERIHETLGEIMVVIGKKVLNVGRHQLLTKQLEVFVRNMKFSRNFVFDGTNCSDFLASFDGVLEKELADLVKGSQEFRKSLIFLKLAISRFVILVCIQVLRSVVVIKVKKNRVHSFEYEDRLDFDVGKDTSPPLKKMKMSHSEVNTGIVEVKEEVKVEDGEEKENFSVNRQISENPTTTSSENHRSKLLDPALQATKDPHIKSFLETAPDDPNIPEECLELINRLVCENSELKRKRQRK